MFNKFHGNLCMEVTLKEILPQEKKELSEILKIYWKEIDQDFENLKIFLDRYVESLFYNKNRILNWILLKKKTIGFIIYYFYNSGIEKNGLHIAEIFLKKDFRGKGHAKDIMQFLGDTHPEIKEMRLEVLKDNERANKFWKQNGFETWKYILKKKRKGI